MVSSVPIYFVDAFTTHGNSPFTGNPAAVCLLDSDDDIPDDIKQKIAEEVNLSETAFVSHRWKKAGKENGEEGSSTSSTGSGNALLVKRTLRWFTPTKEIPLCGHATLASAKALVEVLFKKEPQLKKEKDEIVIEFQSRFRGILGATFNCATEKITLNFPVSPCISLNATGEKWIEELLETTLYTVLPPNSVASIQYSSLARIVMVRLNDDLGEEGLRRVTPDLPRLGRVDNGDGIIGVLVTVKGKDPDTEKGRPHFYSRFFAPRFGVDEDPVTGSAQSVATPYWTKQFFNGFGSTLLANQISARGGYLYCTLIDSERVSLGGDGRILIRGEFLLKQ